MLEMQIVNSNVRNFHVPFVKCPQQWAFCRLCAHLGSEVLYFNTDDHVNFGFKTDFGVTLRYRKVTLTASYEAGTVNVPITHYQHDGTTGSIYDTAAQEIDRKMPMGML